MSNLLLKEAELFSEVKVKKINAEGELRRRLLDLGIIEGTIIKPLFDSPLGNPRAYLIRGTIIAIRESEAKLISVELIE